MIPRRCALLISSAAMVACSGGTIRVADDDSDNGGPVALTPAPEPAAEPAETESPAPVPSPESPSLDTTRAQDQGYAPYGSSGGLEIRRIGQWTRTGIGEARRLVIRDANAWAEFWSELGQGDRPAVDFARDIVVAVASGQRPSGGYEIGIDRATHRNGELIVELVETAPGPNCMSTTSLTQPVDVVVIPAVAPRSWSFVERKEVRGCR
jgi:hypothetical protein